MFSKVPYNKSIDDSVISWIRDDELREIMNELLDAQEQYDSIIEERRKAAIPTNRKTIDKITELEDNIYDAHERIVDVKDRYNDRLEVVITDIRPDRYQAVLEMTDLLTEGNIKLLSVSNVKPRVLAVMHEYYEEVEKKLDTWTEAIYEEYWKLGIFDIDLHRSKIDMIATPVSDVDIVRNILQHIDEDIVSTIEEKWNYQMTHNITPNRSKNEVIIPLTGR